MADQPPSPPPPLPGSEAAVDPAPRAAGQGQGARCRNCGAETTWDPEHDALACTYCGAVAPVPRAEGTILERPLDAGAEAARGLGLALRAVRCRSCGASVALGQADTAGSCAFCGSANVLIQEANRNSLRPESLIPLDVGRAGVEKSFRKWAGALWFRPGALRRARIDQAVGIYVPHWTFDCQVQSAWSADAGHYYYVTVPTVTIVNGKPRVGMRQEQRIRWEPAWGERQDSYDDWLVLASKGVPAELARELGPYDMSQLVPYRPEYLAGWRAEEYQIDLMQGWERGLAEVQERQRARCAGDVPGDTHRNLRVQDTVRDVRWKHVLLPIWSLSYRHGGRNWTVLVHGQTGKVAGKAPLSWAKIAGLVLLIGAAVLAVVAAGAL